MRMSIWRHPGHEAKERRRVSDTEFLGPVALQNNSDKTKTPMAFSVENIAFTSVASRPCLDQS